MKQRVLFLIMLLASSLVSLADDVSEMTAKAEKLYEAKEYQAAAEIYEKLMEQGTSAELYYNYGNTQFRLDNLGQSILFYERALALSPADRDIRLSLEFAQTRTVDKIDGYEPFFLVKWLGSLGKLFNSNTWAWLAIVLFVVALGLGLMFLFSSRIWARKLGFFFGIAMLLLSIVSLAYSLTEKKFIYQNPYAIVLDGSVSVKASPSISGKELFVLHEGTKVRRLGEQKDGWQKVEIADRRVGWLPVSSAEGI